MAEGVVVGVRPWLPGSLGRWDWLTAPVRAERLAALRVGVGLVLLLSSLVVFFLPDPVAALSAWRRLLVTPGGRLAISTFAAYPSASATWFSPAAHGAMYSCAPVPPIIPTSDSTRYHSRPARSKMRS